MQKYIDNKKNKYKKINYFLKLFFYSKNNKFKILDKLQFYIPNFTSIITDFY